MTKGTLSNVVFTVSFLILFLPLCYLLYDYLLDNEITSPPAQHGFSTYNISPISVNRDFTAANEFADKVTVLMYHKVIPEDQLSEQYYDGDGDIVDTTVTLENFTKQMNFLKEGNYTVLSLKEFQGFMEEGKQVPAKSVFITFDDGFKSVFKFAYPVLKKNGFYAVEFLITSLITERTMDYQSSKLQYASIQELVDASDVFDYENHTNNLHKRNVEGVSLLLASSKTKIKKDIAKANNWLGNSNAFAAPYGEYSPTTLEILNKLHVQMGFTVAPGYVEPDQHILEIPRISVSPDYTLADFKYIVEQKSVFRPSSP